VASKRIDKGGQRQRDPKFPPLFKNVTTGAARTVPVESIAPMGPVVYSAEPDLLFSRA